MPKRIPEEQLRALVAYQKQEETAGRALAMSAERLVEELEARQHPCSTCSAKAGAPCVRMTTSAPSDGAGERGEGALGEQLAGIWTHSNRPPLHWPRARARIDLPATLLPETIVRMARFCAEGEGSIEISRGAVLPSWEVTVSRKVVHHYVSANDTENLYSIASGWSRCVDRASASPLDVAINKAIDACERAAKAPVRK